MGLVRPGREEGDLAEEIPSRAKEKDEDVLVAEAVEVLVGREVLLGNLELADFLGGLEEGGCLLVVGDDLLPRLAGDADQLLDVEVVAGEEGGESPPGCVLHRAFDVVGKPVAGGGVARLLRVAGLGKEDEGRGLRKPRDRVYVVEVVGIGAVLDDEVSREDHVAEPRVDGKPRAPGDGVGGLEEVASPIPHLEGGGRLDGTEVEGNVPFPDLLREEAEHGKGDVGAVDGGGGVLVEIDEPAKLVLMPVEEEVGLDAVLVLDEVGAVGDDVVDARHRLVRVAEPAADDVELPRDVDEVAVLPGLVEPSEGKDLDGLFHQRASFPKG